MRVTSRRFEQLVFQAAEWVLDELPPELRAEAETVVLETADAPTAEQGGEEGSALLGLYEGVPLVDRHVDSALLAPDRITLFRVPLQSVARTEVELRHQIHKTIIHELAHFFGRDEDELDARGWG